MRIEGRCHCGEVAYAAEIDPAHVTICHCTDCQKLTGTAFRISVSALRERLDVTGRPPKVYIKTAESGRRRLQYFCDTCGSPMFTTGEGGDADIWGIRWGSIDDREAIVPTRQIWRHSAVNWLHQINALSSSQME